MGLRVAVVGATGNVGREMLNILDERLFPADEVAVVASRRSVGTEGRRGIAELHVCAEAEQHILRLLDLIAIARFLESVLDPFIGDPRVRQRSVRRQRMRRTALTDHRLERYVLEPGDSLYFSSSRNHRWSCVGDEEAVLLWINSPPTF